MRRWAGIAAALAVLLGAAPAHAGPRQESLFQDDDLVLRRTPAEVRATMAELRALGVDRIRISAIWRDIAPEEAPPTAPADPLAYDPARLDPLDVAVRAARDHGLDVLLNVRGGVPEWAEDGIPAAKVADRDAWNPRPEPFAAFVAMLGRRFDGTYEDANDGGRVLPRVSAWSLWNEPNWAGLLQPQSRLVGPPDRRRQWPQAPRIYRDLHRAGAAALGLTGHGADVLLLGETAPVGARSLGVGRPLAAARFMRQLFCLDRRLRPLRGRAKRRSGCDFGLAGPLPATGYAHHPYPIKDPPERRSADRDHLRLADAGRLAAILDAARRHGRLPGRIPVWYTEFGYQTLPPDPYRGIPLRRQAAWLVRAEHLAWRDRRVLGHHQFLLRDSPPNPEHPPDERGYWSTYQTGLRFADGRPKPAYRAYGLPFLALDPVRAGRPLRLWGLVRPGADGVAQTVRIEHRTRPGRGWRPLRTVAVTDPKGYFTVRIGRARAGDHRFVWRSPGGEAASAPAVVKR